MDPAISFYGLNSGLQVGINHGPITAGFHPPPNLDDKLPMVYGAVFDSYMDQHDSGCLPGTRTDILHQISEWAISPQGRCIFWLNGMAGTGKSTIARTVAKSFSQTKSLGASFFFKRGEGDRGNAMKLIPTIARQLASIPKLLTYIQQAVCEDPAIAAKGMTDQFKKLLLQPLLSLKPCDLSIRTVLIVIDALDECDDNDEIRLILQLLPQLQKSSTVRLRVFLTSRPELPLRLGIKKLANHEHKDLILHEISEEVVRRDISLFLNHRLSEIRAEREPPLPMDWPGGTNFQKLVTLSVPLFIFAATICRIFKDPDWDPIDSLTEIVTQRNDESRLGRIYLPVLHRLLNRKSEKQKKQLVQEFHQVVGAIVILKSPLSVISLSRLLGLPERLVYLRLNALHSVLRVPNDETLPVQLFHLSFREFLLDPATCEISPFWVNNKEIHLNLTARCLLTCQKLRKNMCELPSDGAESSKNASQTVDHYLPPELQYACRYWAHHLVQCTDLDDVIRDTLFFLQRHFLHWVEAMILLGLAGEVEGIIDLFQSVALVNYENHPAISELFHDAKCFVLRNLNATNEAPLQLYARLLLTPRTGILRREFQNDLPYWICRLPQVEKSWSAELQDLEGHLGAVYSVAFSPDGRLLASGSIDETVRVWDMATGALLQTLKGHSSWVRSIVFSPDGRLLASGSGDETVLLWDTATGALSRTLEGHSGWVYMVAFAPGGRMLASASKDTTVRLWDTATGALLRNFKGHSNWVRSVAFSLDGQLLASGSNDATVRLWDTATGSLQRTWRVDGEVTCVEFCQGGSHLSTNLGFLNIKSECDNYPNSLHVNMDIVATEPWIKLNGEKVLWLPNEDQPQCSAIYGRILAIGHASGRISFIWLRV